MTTTTTEPTTHTLKVPGATLTYDIRSNATTSEPPLFLVGSPMGAAGFGTLAGHFPDRTVVTYDPRGADRSTLDDPDASVSPSDSAEDLHRVIGAVGGPVDMFASSGGAVNALALVARHPEDVRTLVAHEPPLATQLPDRDLAVAAVRSIHDAYQRGGFGTGMARFMAMTGHRGPFTPEVVAQPDPDPQQFGMPAGDDGNRNDIMLGKGIVEIPMYEPDYEALRAAPTKVILAAGSESAGEMANRGGHAVAERLGMEPVIFPSHHGGFMGGEFGWPGEPEAFAAKLREVLAGA